MIETHRGVLFLEIQQQQQQNVCLNAYRAIFPY